MPVHTITHKGKTIVSVSYEDFRSNELMVKSAGLLRDCVLSQPEEKVLVIIDMTYSMATKEFMAEAKKAKMKVLDSKTTKTAAVGVTGVKKILMKAYNAVSGSSNVVPFDTKEEALDYLVAE